MFNYDFNLPERIIMKDMINELVPLPNIPSNLLCGQMGKFKPLQSSHPNVIKLHSAFIDIFPSVKAMERSELFFPEALPSADIFGSTIFNEPKTLFVVMKRWFLNLEIFIYSRI